MDPDSMLHHAPRFPVETWECIFNYVTCSGDLFNVSLTSHYIHDVVMPILYKRLYLDPNHYSIYTLALLKRNKSLSRRVGQLTLLSPIPRHILPDLTRLEAEALYHTLDIPVAPLLPPHHHLAQGETWSPLGMRSIPSLVEGQVEISSRPVFHFFSAFTNLTSLHIIKDCVPPYFLRWVYQLPLLTTLELRESMVSAALEPKIPTVPLLLQNLTIVKCWTKAEVSENYIVGSLCGGLIEYSPHLISLTVDLFVEREACHVLVDLDKPPPIRTLTCHGLAHQDPDSALLCNVLTKLNTITTLKMTRTPRELGLILPTLTLPSLKRLTGQIKSVAIFVNANRPLQYLTITDAPAPSGGGTPWETQLIDFFEAMSELKTDLKGLAFNVSEWSEELFLCVCQLWPGLKELKIQCTSGPSVDEYFRISFGPRFLPQLQNLEVLHIYERTIRHRFTSFLKPKGVTIVKCDPITLPPDEAEELLEAPIHYRRWEKLCPTLREVAFDREIWWRRVVKEPGGWVLMRDVIPPLAQEST